MRIELQNQNVGKIPIKSFIAGECLRFEEMLYIYAGKDLGNPNFPHRIINLESGVIKLLPDNALIKPIYKIKIVVEE